MFFTVNNGNATDSTSLTYVQSTCLLHCQMGERERVILHELGHINHNPVNYSRCLLLYENQADRFMVRELLKEYLSKYDPNDFNWLYFAETNKIATSWGEQMIQEEFYKLVS